MTDEGGSTAPANHAPGRSALVATVGTILLVGAVAVALLVRGDEPGTAQSSPTPTSAASRSASPASASPAASPTPPSPSPSSRPSPLPSPADGPLAPPTNWSLAAKFDEPGRTVVVNDLATSAGRLIAVGTSLRLSVRFEVFGGAPPRAGRVWQSPDGVVWEDVTPAGVFADVGLEQVFVAADGSRHIIGWEDVDEYGQPRQPRVVVQRQRIVGRVGAARPSR